MKILFKNILFLFFCLHPSVGFASDAGYNDTTSQVAPLNSPDFTGNVGIGSATPGQMLDVKGTIRSTNLMVTSIASGTQCLQANASGVISGTGQPCGGDGWFLAGGTGNVGLSNNNTIGIGTTSGIGAGLVVMNGNVGIGTWNPSDYFQVGKYKANTNGFEVNTKGNVGIAESTNTTASLSVMIGNVGIGTWIATSGMSIIPSDGVSFMQGEGSSVSWNLFDNGSGYALFNITSGNGFALKANDNQVVAFEPNSGSENASGIEVSAGSGSYEGIIGFNGSGDGNPYIENVAGGNGSVDIGAGDGSTWDKLQLKSAVMGTTYASKGIAPTTSGLLVQGDIGIGTYSPAGALEIVGNVGIGSTIASLYVTTTPPAGGMLINGNVGIGTWVPGGKLIIKGANFGIGSVAPSATLVVNSAAAYAGTGVCWGTSGCIGYCTAGTWPNCTTCNCL